MKVARTVLNGESGSNAADLHNTILGNVVLMRTAPKRDLVISHQTRNLIYYLLIRILVAFVS